MTYPIVKLGHIVKVKGGKRLPLGDELVSEKTAHPYVRARDIRDGKVTFSDPVYVTDDIFKKIKNYTVKANDVCITIVGANVGDVGIIPPFLDGANLTENAVKLTELKDCDPFFLNFCLLGSEPQGQMKQYAAGAAQPKLGIYKVNEIDIPLPPFETQRKIASILSAYDDLIENNTRRIKILEEMARMIYREWFVNFRFPGHEQVKMVDSPLGMIPEGWEVAELQKVCDRITDGSHTSPETRSEGYPMASVKDMHDYGLTIQGCRKISEEDYVDLVRNDCKVKKDDILIAKDGSYLKHCFVVENDLDVVLLSSIAMLRPNSQIRTHLLAMILKDPEVKERMRGYVSGVAIPRIVLKDFRAFQIVLPPKNLQDTWGGLAEPLVKLIWRINAKNQNLRQTRDLLLPKLISGEVAV